MQKEEASEHYIDKDAGEYKKIFPLVKYSFPVDLKCSESIEKSLNSNIWYKNSNIKKRAAMIQKLQSFDRIVSQLLDLIQGEKNKIDVKNISIGGSYLYNNYKNIFSGAQDIDFNVLVKGSYFNYYNVFHGINFLKDVVVGGKNIKKISFMIFGEDNIFKGTPIDDSIRSGGYIHTDMTTREGMVFSWRNGVIYGKAFDYFKVNKYNLLVRIARQFYQAKLFLQNKIGIGKSLLQRKAKSLNRILEAMILLDNAFPYIDIPINKVFNQELNIYNRKLIFSNIEILYKEAFDYYNKARKTLHSSERPSLPKVITM